MEIKNKKANYEYFILDKIECGIELKGTEIKSLRKNSADIKDAFGVIKNNEVYILNMYIAKYDEGNRFNHDERRTRKLLLHKKEIKRLKKEKEADGVTLVPLLVYLKGNYVKFGELMFINPNDNSLVKNYSFNYISASVAEENSQKIINKKNACNRE